MNIFRPNGDMYEALEQDLDVWIEDFIVHLFDQLENWADNRPLEGMSDLTLYVLKKSVTAKLETEFDYQIRKRRES